TLAKFKTETGRFRGKLGYLSPEAIQGLPLDGRSDLFSVGVIAHELLTARPLFGAVSDFDTLSRVQFGEVRPPSSMNPHVTPELDAIVMKALAKEVGARWPSGAAMREALLALPGAGREEVGAWVGELQVEKPPPGPLAQALARATPTDQVVDRAWGRPEPGPPTVGLADVPDVGG